MFATPAIAKDPPHPVSGQQPIYIDNGIIDLDDFGEQESYGWYYSGYSNAYWEEPLMSMGTEWPVYLSDGDITQYYPDTGVPDTWYDAKVEVDLDGDYSADIEVTRSIMMPSGAKYFLVKYTIKNIKGSDISNFRFFQGVDYDVAYENSHNWSDDEGGYDAIDFVWAHDLSGAGTYVGFIGDRSSSHHSVAKYSDMWDELEAGSLGDDNYYSGDVGVGLEWDFGTINTGGSVNLTIKYAFADSKIELDNILSPTVPIPEFPSLALPIATILGIMFIVFSRNRKE